MNLENAQLARRNGKYKKSIELYKEVINENSNNAAAYAGLGLTYIHLNKNEDAVAMANKAIQINSNEPLAHIALAFAHHTRGQLEEYKEEVEKAFAIDPFFYEVGCAYAKMLFNDKKIDEAIPVFERIIEANPQKVCPRFLMGLAYSHKKEHRKALSEYTKAFQVKPSLSIAINILVTLINIYRPWSSIIFTVLFVIWEISAFASKIGALTLGIFTFAILLFGGIQKFREEKRGWAVFYFVALIILTYVFYYLYTNVAP